MKRKFSFFSFWLLLALGAATLMFNSCSKDDSGNSSSSEQGVVINGVKWATRNVDKPGTFAANPESAGMFYQWNSKKAWATTGNVTGWTGWDDSDPVGGEWEKANDPSPAGWRVPTLDELLTLCDTNKVSHERTIQNSKTGMIKFTDKATGNSIILPIVGYRDDWNYIYIYDETDTEDGIIGCYWSSTSQYWMYLSIHGCYCAETDGFVGLCIRPVAE